MSHLIQPCYGCQDVLVILVSVGCEGILNVLIVQIFEWSTACWIDWGHCIVIVMQMYLFVHVMCIIVLLWSTSTSLNPDGSKCRNQMVNLSQAFALPILTEELCTGELVLMPSVAKRMLFVSAMF